MILKYCYRCHILSLILSLLYPHHVPTHTPTLLYSTLFHSISTSLQGQKDNGGSSSGTLGGYQSRGSFLANNHPIFRSQNIHSTANSSSRKNSISNQNTTKNNSITQRQIEDQAWNIYLFFVAKGSAYEIMLSPKSKDDIMRKLACPDIDMFNALEAAAKLELDIIFDGYKRNSKCSAIH